MAYPGRGMGLVLRPRGVLPSLCAGGLAAVVLVCAVLFLGHLAFYRLAVKTVLGLALGATLHGICHLAEEWLHHSTLRYGGNLCHMLRSCFNVCPLVAVVVAVLVLGAGCVQLRPDEWHAVGVTCGISLLLKAFCVLGPTPVEISEICEQRKMNVAHGLAWSFYIGYLKLVLPKLEDSIVRYETQNKMRILGGRDSWRLHILLPLSAFIPDKLEDADNHINFFGNLPEIALNRAGVRKRSYKHSVYSILDQLGQPHHCVVEYATPLQTLYQMSQDSSAGMSAQERRQQVLLFYSTLQDILGKSVECQNRYRLILLDEVLCEKDPHFLSKEIVKELQQQQNEEYQMAPSRGELDMPQDGALSRTPTLMISNDMPRSLREPEETTDTSQDYCR